MRALVRILGVVVALAVLAGAAEVALRLIIPNVIANAVREQVGLSEDHPVDVELGGSALLHAITGRVGDVTIGVDDLPLPGGIVVNAKLHADSAPFDPTSGDLHGGTGALTVTGDQLPGVVNAVTRGIAETGEVRDGELVVGRDVTLLGFTVPVSLGLELGVSGGDVQVTPTQVSASGLDLSSEQIAGAAAPVLGDLLETHTVCIADELPRGITLTGIDLSTTGSATLQADLSPGILSDSSEQEPGVCE